LKSIPSIDMLSERPRLPDPLFRFQQYEVVLTNSYPVGGKCRRRIAGYRDEQRNSARQIQRRERISVGSVISVVMAKSSVIDVRNARSASIRFLDVIMADCRRGTSRFLWSMVVSSYLESAP
jgi:hypothetical protein